MLTLFAYLFLAATTQADISHVNHYFQVANEAYQKGEYDQAIENYDAALELGYANESLYYNLANAYFKQDKLGRAILYYERAKKLAPRDPDIQFNLAVANLYVVDKVTAIPPHIFAKIWAGFRDLISTNQLAILFAVFYILTMVIWVVKLVVRHPTLNRWAYWSFVPLIAITVVLSALFLARVNENAHSRSGIVMTEKVDVKNSPSEDASEAFALHEGTKVSILDQSGNFFKISIADGNIGWLPQTAIEII